MKKILLAVVFLSCAAFGQTTVIGACSPAQTPCRQTSWAVSLTGQTIAIGSFGSPIAMFTPTTTGTYEVNLTIYLTAQGTAGTFQLCAEFKTVSSTVTATCVSAMNTTATLGSAGTAVISLSAPYRVLSGTPVSYYVLASGITGSPTYGIDVVVHQIQ